MAWGIDISNWDFINETKETVTITRAVDQNEDGTMVYDTIATDIEMAIYPSQLPDQLESTGQVISQSEFQGFPLVRNDDIQGGDIINRADGSKLYVTKPYAVGITQWLDIDSDVK